jgi:hypothetical protein
MSRKLTPKSEPAREEAFAKRLTLACDNHRECPPLHKGRLVWIVDQLRKRFGVDISTETARKWCSGDTRPRPSRMSLLAELLLVDEAWLALDAAPEATPNERRARNAMAGGAVNIVAGMIEFDGGHPAFPEPDDKRASDVDLYAIIRGAQYGFKVVVGLPSGGKSYKFTVPIGYRDVFVIGLVRTGACQWDVLELDTAMIDRHKERRGGHVEVTVDKRGAHYLASGGRVRQLSGFSERP